MPKKAIATTAAPKAVGPYSQAVEMGDCVYISGSIPLDPVTGEIVGGDVKVQTMKVFENLKAILKEANLTPKDVVKTTVFMTDLTFFAEMNEMYAAFFEQEPYPARSTVQVAALPKGSQIEIEAVAIRSNAPAKGKK